MRENLKSICFVLLPTERRGDRLERHGLFHDGCRRVYEDIFGVVLTAENGMYHMKEPPLWALSLAPVAADLAWSCSVCDLSDRWLDDVSPCWVEEFPDCSIYAFSPLTKNVSGCLSLVAALREVRPHARLLFGGPHATFEAEVFLQRPYDAVVHGEGENVLANILSRPEAEWHTIPNLTYLDGQGVSIATRRTRKLMPAASLRTLEYGLLNWRHRHPVARVYGGRGCAYNCAFCANTIWKNNRPVFKEARMFEAEVSGTIRWCDPEVLFLADETTMLNGKHMSEVCRVMRSAGLPWFCQSRPDQVSGKSLAYLRESGCRMICLGAETSSEESLRAVGKGFSYNDVVAACRMAKAEGLAVLTYWLVGLPRETELSIRNTQRQICQLISDGLTDLVEYFIAVPYPGTSIYRNPGSFDVRISKDFDRFIETGVSCMGVGSLEPEEIFGLWDSGMLAFGDTLRQHVSKRRMS